MTKTANSTIHRILPLSAALAMALGTSLVQADVHKVVGQMNITIDSSSEKGPGAEKGTSIQSNASRLGMLGSMETVLNDTNIIYKAVFQYEGSGENDQTVLLRDAFVGLKSKQNGTLRLGRLTTGYKSSYTKIDPWTDQILQARQSGQQGASNLNSNYFNNAIDYTSVKIAGTVQFNAFYSVLPDTSTDRLHNSGKLKDFTGGSAAGVGLKYTSGGLRFTADTLEIDADATGTLTNGTAKKIGAQYKFDDGFTLAGHYEDVTDLMLGTNYWLHGSKKMGNTLLTASYGVNEGDPTDNVYTSATKGDADTYSLGVQYSLNKKAKLIAGYNSHERDGGDDSQTFTVGFKSKFGY